MPKASELKAIGLFSGFDEGLLDCLAPALEEIVYKDGAVIFREEDPGDAMYFIASGAVEITKGPGSEDEACT